jgi:hypothetical protein
MTGVAIDDGFPVGRCAPCGRDVLAHLTLDSQGRECRCCVHCDAELDPEELRWVPTVELDTFGYAVEDEGGCGREGCGKGICPNRR